MPSSPSAPAELRCPGCGDSMIEVDSSGVHIDVCTSCNGLWLDKGELERLGGKLPSHRDAKAKASHLCPRCHFPMDLRDAHLAEIDLCWGCGGLFLASESFDRLVAAGPGRGPDPDDDAVAARDQAREEAAPASGAPVLVAAAGAVAGGLAGPASPAATPSKLASAPAAAGVEPPSPGGQRRVFWCDFCREATPVEQQVIGEHVTVCPACAQRHEIVHSPAARQRAEREKAFLNRSSHRSVEPNMLYAILGRLLPFI